MIIHQTIILQDIDATKCIFTCMFVHTNYMHLYELIKATMIDIENKNIKHFKTSLVSGITETEIIIIENMSTLSSMYNAI